VTTRVERRPLLGRHPARLLGAARLAAALVLTGLAGLVATALVPQVAGFSAHVVTSGSMAPRVQPGDVVLTQPATAGELRVGQVLLFADPARPGGLLLHRLVSFDGAGLLVTRGDANQSDDSEHVAASAVRGVARVRVPWVGLPAVWRAQGRLGLVATAAATLAGAAVLVSSGRRRRPDAAAPRPAPGSSAGVTPPMTEARRRVGHDTAVVAYTSTAEASWSAGEEGTSAPSAGRSLPPVPPAAARPGRRPGPGRPAGGAGPAGRRHGPAGDHSRCFDGGRLCGQPRR
jgi:signal peptidase